MKIGLIDVDSKIPNLALMKISAYYKAQKDSVEFYQPYMKYDLVYASKIFDFTKDYQYFPEFHIAGGSGYDLKTKLPSFIEYQYPDYSLYNCLYAMGFITRGCIRNCPFCIVPEKEGKIRQVAEIKDFWNGQQELMLLDNNLTAMPNVFRQTVETCINNNIKVDFSQGLDARLIDDEKAQLLSKVKLWKQIHFAWDNIKDEKEVLHGLRIMLKHNSPQRLMVYVLIGFNSTPEEDLYRVEKLRSLKLDPFVMPYNKKEKYQKDFSRWVNHKAIFKSVSWKDYQSNIRKERLHPNQATFK